MIKTLNVAWIEQLKEIVEDGHVVSPRGQETLEILQKTLVFDMNYPVVTVEARKMGYKFMAAEAWWILSGKNDVASIAPYSKEISKFSDNGVDFFGSYGPPILDQIDYVVQTLERDPDTRQAVLTTWRPNPPITKDVPCTVAFSFMIRDGKLNCHVFMRSSDNWLGVPYDSFNFTMIACEVTRRLNDRTGKQYGLGTMHLTAASSHLYARDYEKICEVLTNPVWTPYAPVPKFMYGHYGTGRSWDYFSNVDYLGYTKDVSSKTEIRYRWWQRPVA